MSFLTISIINPLKLIIDFEIKFKQTCKDLKVAGALGNCHSLHKKSLAVGETEIGIGGTTAWKLCSIDEDYSISVYFDTSKVPV